jgi:hypothetical protein
LIAIVQIAWAPVANREIFGVPLAGFLVGMGMLMLSTSAAGSLAEERERESLDVLLSTPLSTGAILRGEWWGAYRRFVPLALLPALIAASLALQSGRWNLASALSTFDWGVGVPPLGGPDRLKPGLQPLNSPLTRH